MTCRDRNRLALQGDLLGAAALGIHNILVLAGDDPKAGDQPEAKPVLRPRQPRPDRDGAPHAHASTSCRPAPRSRASSTWCIGAADVPVDPPPDWKPEGPARQGRGRRGFRADAVLHGHRRRAPLRGAAARARLQAADPDRRGADSVGALGALDAREAVRHHRPRRDRRAAGEGRRPEGAKAAGSASRCCRSSPRSPASPART